MQILLEESEEMGQGWERYDGLFIMVNPSHKNGIVRIKQNVYFFLIA
jgi:hypothetical protein